MNSRRTLARQGLLAGTYGFVAGIASALVLWLMSVVSKWIWSGSDEPWYVFLAIAAGGATIALLQFWHAGQPLSAQIEGVNAPQAPNRRDALLLALMAIVAVGFGGAVGPEAGILAVVAEMTALITWLIARNAGEARLISEAGAAGALGGLYGSPPGGAAMAQIHPEAPRWQVYLAAIAGLAGFLLATGRYLLQRPMQISLPPHVPAGDGSDMAWSVLPALLGAAMGMFFVLALPRVQKLLGRCGGTTAQTLAGSLLFAALAAAFPILRFSGHHEIEAMLHWAKDAGVGALLVLGALKALALALCLAAGWRGGSAFPLLFAGAAGGVGALWLLPGTPVTAAIVAGMTAAITAGMGKPVAAMLIALFLIGPAAVGPLCVGGLVGWGASKLLPATQLH
jgi:H+/Cl- antiporter ClcA